MNKDFALFSFEMTIVDLILSRVMRQRSDVLIIASGNIFVRFFLTAIFELREKHFHSFSLSSTFFSSSFLSSFRKYNIRLFYPIGTNWFKRGIFEEIQDYVKSVFSRWAFDDWRSWRRVTSVTVEQAKLGQTWMHICRCREVGSIHCFTRARRCEWVVG